MPSLCSLDSPAVAKSGDNLAEENSRDENRALVHQLSNESRLSITDSLSEFFDAQEVLLSPSSSENEISDDDSYVSDISDNLSLDNLSNDLDNERQTLGPVLESGGEAKSRRRTCLPAPCPSSSNISLWNILRNNIGKDLSKVAMPVELNEPLNTLQRLCEELEYSELLDKAAQIPSPWKEWCMWQPLPYQRMHLATTELGASHLIQFLEKHMNVFGRTRASSFFQNRSATIRLSLHAMLSLEILFSGKM